jgi:NAD(P)-dependent dehydrogenase (short-subunit alcohol dehydrogenase family)
VAAAARTALAALGPAEILVNNAGMIRPGSLADLSLADWIAVLGVNLTGFFLCACEFGAQMREAGRGSIVNMASIASTFATPFTGAYSVSKAGVAMLSRQLAVEWGPEGVRSNAVCPGMILTELSQTMYERPGVLEARSAAIPSRRIGLPDDIAEAVLFLASDRSSYLNGAEIAVDGGFTRNLLSLVPRAGYEPARETSSR